MTGPVTFLWIWVLVLLAFEVFALAAMLKECRAQEIELKFQFSILEIWAVLCGLAPTLSDGRRIHSRLPRPELVGSSGGRFCGHFGGIGAAHWRGDRKAGLASPYYGFGAK